MHLCFAKKNSHKLYANIPALKSESTVLRCGGLSGQMLEYFTNI